MTRLDPFELGAREHEAERARLLEVVVDQMPGGVVVAEAPSGRIVLGNARMERILGHPVLEAPDVRGYRRYGAEHADGRPYAPQDHPLARALAGERVEAAEVRYRRPDGDLRILSANAAPVLGADGRVYAAIVAFFDVTDRWRAESHLQLLAEASLAVAASLDPAETTRSVVDLAIPQLADVGVVYLLEGDILRRSHTAGASADRAAAFDAYWAREVRADERHPAWSVVRTARSLYLPEVTDEDLRRAATDAEHLERLRALSIRSALLVPLTGRKKVRGALGFLLTERGRAFDALARQTAEQLGRRAGIALYNAELYGEAQEAIRSREEVLSVVSHDLRSPLGIVGLTASRLLHRAQQEADRRLAASAQALQNAASRMRRFIDDLLDLASIDAGRLRIASRPEEMADLFVELSTTHAELAASVGRRLDLEVTAELAAARVLCDRERVLQVLGNLVDNALKHAPEGSVVHVRARRAGDTAVLSVADDGPGIPAKDHGRLFERFWQRKHDVSGVGLGLSIARGIVEAHGGRIWVESAPDAGSCFSFSLPLAD
jgi:PAS domain S-box-containing protein